MINNIAEEISIKVIDCPSLLENEAYHFNKFKFFKLHNDINSKYLTFNYNDNIIAIICFQIDLNLNALKSPIRGSFGGLQIFTNNLNIIDQVFDSFMSFLANEKIKFIEITENPFLYNEEISKLKFFSYIKHGFILSNTDINAIIKIDNVDLVDKMEYNNVKRYKKCVREGLTLAKKETVSLTEAYKIIQANRDSKGFKMSMNLDQLLTMNNAMPESIVSFIVKNDNLSIASAICIKISKETLYVFYWGDLPGNEKLSPIAFLASNIYSYCQLQDIKLLDLGTSSIDGNIIPSLLSFKKSIGASFDNKNTWTKQIL
jgi:hypothetical protein